MNGQRSGRGGVFFYVLFGVLAIAVLWLLSPYLGVIAIALVTVVMLKPLYDWFIARGRIVGHPRVATTLTLLSFFLLIIVPLFIAGWLMVNQSGELIETLSSVDFETALVDLAASIEEFLRDLPGLSDIEFDSEQLAQTLITLASAALSWLVNLLISLGASLPALFIGVIVFLIVVATMLPILDELQDKTENLSPLDVKITHIYLLKAQEMIVSVVKGVFLLAVLQGLIMGVFYWLAGVPFAIFWTLLSMVFAIMPVVGISFIVLPIVIIFFLSGNWQSALILLFGFYVIVNPMDLILRPKLVSKEAYLNFTLMLLALFGGLALGGLLGMIYGPVVMILFMTTIDIYSQYFSGSSEEPAVVDVAELEPETLSGG
jgi:predicted PurR-regulated permease PerM